MRDSSLLVLANLALLHLDSRLAGWAAAAGATYTRYADDLAFSGDRRLASRADAFVAGIHRIVEEEGHTLNLHKSRVSPSGVKQTVTGIVVNTHTNMARNDYDRLKATIHNCVVMGPSSQNLENRPDFRAHILGRPSWLESLAPVRTQRLREEFARIRW